MICFGGRIVGIVARWAKNPPFKGVGEKYVVARMCRAVRNALKQAWVAGRMASAERGQVGKLPVTAPETVWRVSFGALGPVGHARRRNTKVPLVPPKPKELDMATSIFMSRGVFGT